MTIANIVIDRATGQALSTPSFPETLEDVQEEYFALGSP